MTAFQSSGPTWIDIAARYIGEREIKGPKHNSKILEWWEKMKAPYRDDETAWCGAFVGGVLVEAGLPAYPKGAGARNWLEYGTPLSQPAVGCIVVFWRGSKSGWSGHVGFVVGKDQAGNLMVLGGNQGDMVSIKPFGKDRILGYRWPSIAPVASRYVLPVLRSDGRLSTDEA
ncbi:TIGR02594 family protein [Phyllobacterium myrsinacearum]|uniref:Uncharacterized protein (TIGR02594 family) n=1 Tax=Phyllobacterium myrsinacearum TaxID=28101 RepID=A0A839EME5_9HYPH|nr:TIGR02594 family protein [Phyllobacterium myrsinacearum]MBA8881743.1 uncharacterized protein (TIGR02594 family) [Phyllobacterium myrsinacearum]